ncbi:hypothetical protein AX15_001723 [Amanita polypyramis BW_CC]|nr:hypothetical protein AX15_001723 [Amanita polypyramis BW_CC]
MQEPSYIHEVKEVIVDMLDRLQIPFKTTDYDQDFHAACYKAAKERGIPLEGKCHMGRHTPIGIVMSTTAFAHLPSYETRIWIALYTAAFLAVEDICGHDADLLKGFYRRFSKGVKHGHPILDYYDLILREIPNHFEPFVADIMLQSCMDFIVAVVIECEMEKKPISASAKTFPGFLRILSGHAKMYAILVYPSEIPLQSYVEAIPALMNYLDYVNDVLSFYKEETGQESVNLVSNIARCNGQTKLQVLKQLADESAEAHRETLAVLSQHPDALEAYRRFSAGYVHFHIASARYMLADLWSM